MYITNYNIKIIENNELINKYSFYYNKNDTATSKSSTRPPFENLNYRSPKLNSSNLNYSESSGVSYAHSNNYIRKDLYQPEENEYDDLKCDDNNEYSELTSNYQPQVNSFSPNQNEIPVPIVNFNVPFPCLNPRPRFNSINVFGNNYMNMFNANGNYTTEKFGRKGWV